MTFVNDKNCIESSVNKTSGLNPFGGIGQKLSSKISNIFLTSNEVTSSSKNFKVQSNPLYDSENFATTNQLNGGHSKEYNVAPNSIFDTEYGSKTSFDSVSIFNF